MNHQRPALPFFLDILDGFEKWGQAFRRLPFYWDMSNVFLMIRLGDGLWKAREVPYYSHCLYEDVHHHHDLAPVMLTLIPRRRNVCQCYCPALPLHTELLGRKLLCTHPHWGVSSFVPPPWQGSGLEFFCMGNLSLPSLWFIYSVIYVSMDSCYTLGYNAAQMVPVLTIASSVTLLVGSYTPFSLSLSLSPFFLSFLPPPHSFFYLSRDRELLCSPGWPWTRILGIELSACTLSHSTSPFLWWVSSR
jgi:hypothetical protein